MTETAGRVRIALEQGDVIGKAGDVLALKQSSGFHGVDRLVAQRLGLERGPDVGEVTIVEARGGVQADEVLFVGVVGLSQLRYGEIRAFAARVVETLAAERPGCGHLLMTLHGVGFGLDETEAFLAQIGGLRDAIDGGHAPDALRRVTIVELDEDRVERLAPILDELQAPAAGKRARTAVVAEDDARTQIATAGITSEEKPHAFVAMPFTTPMKNVFNFGIRPPVRKSGMLCELVSEEAFTGDIVARVLDRIRTASLVVAEITTANANVFLEVGFAWGAGRPVILVAQDAKKLPFDVRGQRCLEYGEDIAKLAKLLRRELAGLREAGVLTDRETDA
jgi:hypothetical protein